MNGRDDDCGSGYDPCAWRVLILIMVYMMMLPLMCHEMMRILPYSLEQTMMLSLIVDRH